MKLRILLAGAAIAAFALSVAAAPPQISFEAPNFVVTATPGASVAYIYRGSNGRHGAGVLADSDADGKVTIDTAATLPKESYDFIAVDLSTGEHAASVVPGRLTGNLRTTILRGPSGAHTELVTTVAAPLVLWVRPGVGAWAPPGHHLEAEAFLPYEYFVGSVTTFQRLGKSPALPAGLAHGDLLFALHADSPPQGGLVDGKLDVAPHPGDLAFHFADAATAIEGNDVVLRIVRVFGSSGTVSVKFTVSSGSAKPGIDYVRPEQVVTFGPGELVKSVRIPTIDDGFWEGTRLATAELSQPTGGSYLTSPATRSIGILDNDSVPALEVIGPSSITETDGPQTISAVVSVTGGRRDPVTVSYRSPGDTVTRKLIFQPGEIRKQVPLTVPGNDIAQRDYFLTIPFTLDATNRTVNYRIQVIDDDSPALIVPDASGREGATVRLQVSVSPVSPNGSFTWRTVDGTATSRQDYVAASGTNGEVELRLKDDDAPEGDETFYVDFTTENLVPAKLRVAVTIIDDDVQSPPVFSNVRVQEGTGTGWQRHAITLTLPAPLPHPITYVVTHTGGTATRDVDYQAEWLSSGLPVTFQAGETAVEVPVQIDGDELREPDETFKLSVAGTTANANITIVDDDSPRPAISIEDISVTEGTGTDRTVAVRVSLSAAATDLVTVDIKTAAGTAAYGVDYIPAADATLEFRAGDTVRDFSVHVVGDAAGEPAETFFVTLSNPVGALLKGPPRATVTILDDDAVAPDRRRSARH